MSCGSLHGQEHEFHLHAPGDEHHDEQETRPENADETESTPQEPGPVRRALASAASHMKTAASSAWTQHGYLIKPFGLIPAMDGSGWFIHQVYGGNPLHALEAAAITAAASAVTSETVNHLRDRANPVRLRSRIAVGTAAAFMAVGGAWTFNGPVAIATAAAGALLGGMLAYEEHKARGDRIPGHGGRIQVELPAWLEPPAIQAPAGPDPRLLLFTERFCGPGGKLAGTSAEFREVTNGFLFELDFTGTEHSPKNVAELEIQIAKLFNTRSSAVSVEYVPSPGKDSENYCQVVIRKTPVLSTQERVKPAVKPWDGLSTWNPETGCVDLGWFIDDTITRYRLHVPNSGALMGMVTGVMGSGKTGTINILGCEAGLAKLCRTCGYARSCPKCSPERVMAVWMADAQGTGLSVWHERADLTAVGPEGCIEMLDFAEQVANERAKERLQMVWSDTDPVTGRTRANRGKGSYDVEIGWPLIFMVLDEFPKLIRHEDPEIRARAKRHAVTAVTEWRKLGIHVLFASAALDTTLTGDRAIRDLIKFFNMVVHRADESTSSMAGILGDATRLPRDLPGAGFISGFDDRTTDTQFATKFARETALPGEALDIRHLAGAISQTPLLYDPATLRVMESWKIPHRHVFDTWYGNLRGGDGASAPALTLAAAQQRSAQQPMPATGTPVPAAAGCYREDAEAVRKCLLTRPGTWTYPELMKETGLSLGAVKAVAVALEANGQVTLGNKQMQAA